MLKISMLLNLGLAGCLIYTLAYKRPVAVIPATVAVNQPMPALAQPAPSRPFQWDQLFDSVDYHAYVKNLRATGCPEPTVRDIVLGDADRAFSLKRSQLNLDGSGTGPWSQAQEMKLVANLLGDVMAPNISEPSIQAQPFKLVAAASSYPLVFQTVDLDALGMNADEKQAVSDIQQQFVAEIGGANQDPNDPAYFERWQKALSDSNDTLKAMVGITIFQNYQLAVGNAGGL